MVKMMAMVSAALWFVLMFLESVKDNIRLLCGVFNTNLILELELTNLGH